MRRLNESDALGRAEDFWLLAKEVEKDAGGEDGMEGEGASFPFTRRSVAPRPSPAPYAFGAEGQDGARCAPPKVVQTWGRPQAQGVGHLLTFQDLHGSLLAGSLRPLRVEEEPREVAVAFFSCCFSLRTRSVRSCGAAGSCHFR